jgi:hypothetical protein
MGLNAQTSVPAFTTGQVLTAQQQTDINTGIPVFADSTARDAAFGGTGEKTLAEGQYAYLESTKQTLVYDGSNWVTVAVAPGLVLVSSTTIGSAVASVTVTGAFSATYENYKITLSGGTASANANLALQLGATTTGYYAGYSRVTYSTGAASLLSDNNAANFLRVGAANTDGLSMTLDLLSPNLAKNTFIAGIYTNPIAAGTSGSYGGFVNDTTAYTAFTIITSPGTLTGGVIRVYGYANS